MRKDTCSHCTAGIHFVGVGYAKANNNKLTK
jgi:hypothetical protein